MIARPRVAPVLFLLPFILALPAHAKRKFTVLS